MTDRDQLNIFHQPAPEAKPEPEAQERPCAQKTELRGDTWEDAFGRPEGG